MNLAGLDLVKLNQSTIIKPFDCDDEDLNDFLINKAKNFQLELLAVTYLLEDNDRTVAYISIFNDSLRIQDLEFASKGAFKRFLSAIVSHPKRHLKFFPALKIGRLGVCKTSKGNGIGKSLVYYIINLAIEQNSICACKFLTVDAYEESLGFYERLNFGYFSEADKGDDTRQMYLDLTPYLNVIADE